jgi:hypothetical protein
MVAQPLVGARKHCRHRFADVVATQEFQAGN